MLGTGAAVSGGAPGAGAVAGASRGGSVWPLAPTPAVQEPPSRYGVYSLFPGAGSPAPGLGVGQALYHATHKVTDALFASQYTPYGAPTPPPGSPYSPVPVSQLDLIAKGITTSIAAAINLQSPHTYKKPSPSLAPSPAHTPTSTPTKRCCWMKPCVCHKPSVKVSTMAGSGCSRTNPVEWSAGVVKREPGAGVPCQVAEVTTSEGGLMVKVEQEEQAVPTTINNGNGTIPVGIAVARQRHQQDLGPQTMSQGLLATASQPMKEISRIQDIETTAALGGATGLSLGGATGNVLQCSDDRAPGLAAWPMGGASAHATPTLWQYPAPMPIEPMLPLPIPVPPLGYQLVRDPSSGHFLLIPTASLEQVSQAVVWPSYPPPSSVLLPPPLAPPPLAPLQLLSSTSSDFLATSTTLHQHTQTHSTRLVVTGPAPQDKRTSNGAPKALPVLPLPLPAHTVIKIEDCTTATLDSTPGPQPPFLLYQHPNLILQPPTTVEPPQQAIQSIAPCKSQATSPVACLTPPPESITTEVQDASNQTDHPEDSEEDKTIEDPEVPEEEPLEPEKVVEDVKVEEKSDPDISGLELLSNSIVEFENRNEAYVSPVKYEKPAEVTENGDDVLKGIAHMTLKDSETEVTSVDDTLGGLGLLCALAEQRFMEEVSEQRKEKRKLVMECKIPKKRSKDEELEMEKEKVLNKVTTERGLTERCLPERGLPERISSERGSSEKGSSVRGFPERCSSERSLSERCLPERASSERGLPDKGLFERSLPERGVPERWLADKGLPERCLPERGLAEKCVPERNIPARGLPERCSSEKGLPERAYTDRVPEKGLLETNNNCSCKSTKVSRNWSPEFMSAIERDMRQELADLQRKCKEKKLEISKLSPPKKLTTPPPQLDKIEPVLTLKPTQELLKPPVLCPITKLDDRVDTTKFTKFDGKFETSKRRSQDAMLERVSSSKKRKVGRPKKLMTTPGLRVATTETIVAKKPRVKAGLVGYILAAKNRLQMQHKTLGYRESTPPRYSEDTSSPGSSPVKTKPGKDKNGGSTPLISSPCFDNRSKIRPKLKAEPTLKPPLDSCSSSSDEEDAPTLPQSSSPPPAPPSPTPIEDEDQEDEEPVDETPEEPITKIKDSRCILTAHHLGVDKLRVLTAMGGLFYAGQLTAVRAPDVYAITLDGERGNRPHIMSREEILRDAIVEVSPTSTTELLAGTRLCAYWSQQYRCLYPGTVAEPGTPDPQLDLKFVCVEFDDGDSGRIALEDIRLLPSDYPIIEYDPNPLLSLSKRRRRTSVNSIPEKRPLSTQKPPATPPTLIQDTPKPTPQAEKENTDINRQIDHRERKKLKKRRKEKLKKLLHEDKKKKRKHRCCDEKCKHRKHHKKHRKHKKHHHSREVEEAPEEVQEEVPEEVLEDAQEEAPEVHLPSPEPEVNDEEEEEDDVVVKKENKHKKSKNKERRESAESRSKMAAFLPARQLWSWSGRGYKRVGVKGRARKQFFKAIQRGKESIMVGDCAVFLSTGRPDRPYIGKIEAMWESWGTNMVVRVKWFYHPEETVGCPLNLKFPGALFESPHVDENDVQTISHKCEVLPLKDYTDKLGPEPQRYETIYDNNDIYYLAGYYDPTTTTLTMKPDIPFVN